jgi:hypothetical protein
VTEEELKGGGEGATEGVMAGESSTSEGGEGRGGGGGSSFPGF